MAKIIFDEERTFRLIVGITRAQRNLFESSKNVRNSGEAESIPEPSRFWYYGVTQVKNVLWEQKKRQKIVRTVRQTKQRPKSWGIRQFT